MYHPYNALQIPSDMLKMVEKGEDLRIVGSRSGEAVLCSSNKTFALKRVETSNCGMFCVSLCLTDVLSDMCVTAIHHLGFLRSVLFVPPSEGPRFTIESLSADYYEVI